MSCSVNDVTKQELVQPNLLEDLPIRYVQICVDDSNPLERRAALDHGWTGSVANELRVVELNNGRADQIFARLAPLVSVSQGTLKGSATYGEIDDGTLREGRPAELSASISIGDGSADGLGAVSEALGVCAILSDVAEHLVALSSKRLLRSSTRVRCI
jgi:hypothetical protein